MVLHLPGEYLKKIGIAILIGSFVFGMFFIGSSRTQGASNTFVQTSWAGNADTNAPFPVHGTDQTGWTKYYAKDAGITAGTEIVLNAVASSSVQTSAGDFSAGTTSSTTASGGDVTLSVAAAPGDLAPSFGTAGVVSLADESNNTRVYASAIDSLYLYAVGTYSISGASVHRLEKRNLTDGALVSAFGTSGVVEIDPGTNPAYWDMAVDANYIYMVGLDFVPGNLEWRIEKRDISTGALVTAFDTDGVVNSNPGSGNEDIARAVAVDSSYIYIGGSSGNASDIDQWRIEKRDITTGALVTAFDTDGIVTTHPSTIYYDVIKDIAIDSSSMYVVGYQNRNGGGSNSYWHIEKRNLTTGALVTAFDTDGKIDVTPSSGEDEANAIVIDSSNLYVGGFDNSGGTKRWRVEKRNLTTGALVSAFGTSGVVIPLTENSSELISLAILANNYLYLGGYAKTPDAATAYQWHTEVRDITDGSLETAFSGDGIIVSNADPKQSELVTLVADASALYAAGYRISATTNKTVWRIEKYAVVTLYAASGNFTSSAIDLGVSGATLGNISWTETLPANTDIQFQIRSAATEGGLSSATWYGPTGAGDYYTTSAGEAINDSNNGYQWVQYKAFFTSDTTATSTLSDVTIAYTAYPASATLTGSPFNSSSSTNILNSIAWSETLLDGTDVKFQLRTSPDNATWTSYMGPDGTNGSYFTNPAGGETVPAALTNLTDDQWIQYKVWLTTTDGATTPTLSDITVTYVANTAPEFNPVVGNNGVSATQNADGTVTITYSVRDTDSTSSTVTPSFEFSTNGGSSFSAITSGLAAGDTNAKAVETSAYTLYTATWTPSSQAGVGTSTYEEDFQIQVTVDDEELANATAVQASSNFRLDTTVPTSGSVLIDSTSNQLTLAISDSSPMAMKISNNSNLSADGSNNDSGQWIAYGTDANSDGFGDAPISASVTKSWTLSGSDPETVYVQFKDDKGNTTSTVSATTPRKPGNVIYQDISNTATSEWKIFLAWGIIPEPNPGFANYKLYISTNGTDYSLETTIPDDRNVNYYIDTELSTGTTYYYKLRSQDDSGNISEWSSVVSDDPDGQGGSDLTSPSVTSVVVASTATTSATITWTTDELSNSTIGYSLDTAYGTETGVASMVSSHSVTITGLSPSTIYNFRVKSTDPSGNISDWSTPSSFTTASGPAISIVSAISITNNTATISWATDIASDSTIIYSVNSDLSSSQQTNVASSVTDHSVSLSGLTQGTKYYYSVRSTDASSNIGNDTNGGVYYTFTTTIDSTGPVIASASIVATASTNSVTMAWTTSELATTQVEYGLTNAYGTTTTRDDALTIQHAVIVNELSESTTYNYRVISRDANGNSTTSSNQTFTTGSSSLIDPTPDVAPVISNVLIPVVNDTAATITWTTNENATSQVFYGTTIAYGNQTAVNSTLTVQHSVTLTSLAAQTQYYLKVRSLDSSDNASEAGPSTFTTVGTTLFSGGGGLTGVTEKIVYVEKPIQTIQTQELTITDFFENLLARTKQDDKETVLERLSTTLDEIAKDIPAPNITGVDIDDGQGTTVVSWQTDVPANSLVSFGKLVDMQKDPELVYLMTIGQPDEQVLEHKVSLYDLEQASEYGFRISSKSHLGQTAQSEDFTFQTKAKLASIGDYQITDISERTATFIWDSSEPTNSEVVYTPYRRGQLAVQETKTKILEEAAIRHKVVVDDLEPGTTYAIELQGKSGDGNIISKSIPQFSTTEDMVPPQISQVRTNSAISSSGDQIQTIISWITNEPAASQVLYQEGVQEAIASVSKTPLSSGFLTNHTVVITSLKAATVYKFWVEATDSTGNKAVSQNYTLFTPQKRQSVTQLIFQNLQKNFKWTEQLRF